jgi:hypothetical protein
MATPTSPKIHYVPLRAFDTEALPDVQLKTGHPKVGPICKTTLDTGTLGVSEQKTSSAVKSALRKSSVHCAAAKAKADSPAIKETGKDNPQYRCFNDVTWFRHRPLFRDDPDISKKVALGIHSSDPLARAYYFHTTTSAAVVESILETGYVESRHEGLRQGAYVSTRLEEVHGNYILGFNRTIETTCKVLVKDAQKEAFPFLWVGLEKIPVTALEYVAVHGDKSASELTQLSEKFSRIAGRPIEIVPASVVMPVIEQRAQQDGVCIPEQWAAPLN